MSVVVLRIQTDDFTPECLYACAGQKRHATVAAAVLRWPEFAAPAGVPEDWTRRVAATHRLALRP